MSTDADTTESPPEDIVRGLLGAFESGRVLDVLNAFALDAVILDDAGHEHRGIREIAAFVNRAKLAPQRIEEITRDRDTVTAIVRSAAGGRHDRLRHTYTVGAGRVRSLRIEKPGAHRGHPRRKPTA